MNILVISQYYHPEPFRIHEICEELVRRGNQVTVITGIPNYPDGEVYPGYANENSVEQLDGVTVYRCAMQPRHQGSVNLARNYLSFVQSVNRFIDRKTIDFSAFDAIYAYQLSPVTSVLPALKIRKKYGIPMLLYCLDVWPESVRDTVLEREPFFSALKALSRKIYTSADCLAVTSPSFVGYLSSLCGKPAETIRHIPQHANPVEPVGEPDDSLAQYAQFTNFVFMGNVGESQNVECILRAAAAIRDRSNFRIHIVGSGSRLDACMALAKELAVEDAVIFHGRHPKSEMPKYYALADVCLVSLKDQGIVGCTIPGKLQEYMSAGKAILGCLNGDSVAVIREADCGLCVGAADTAALAHAIQTMSADREKLPRYGENAKKYYNAHFRLSIHADALETLLREITL